VKAIYIYIFLAFKGKKIHLTMLKKYVQTNLPPINFVLSNESLEKNVITPEASFVRFL
jgi:hypothetical protein